MNLLYRKRLENAAENLRVPRWRFCWESNRPSRAYRVAKRNSLWAEAHRWVQQEHTKNPTNLDPTTLQLHLIRFDAHNEQTILGTMPLNDDDHEFGFAWTLLLIELIVKLVFLYLRHKTSNT